MNVEGRCRRGCDLFRPSELAERLGDGVSDVYIKAQCKLWRTSRGKQGLAHSCVGKGYMIRADAVDDWLRDLELVMAGEHDGRRRRKV